MQRLLKELRFLLTGVDLLQLKELKFHLFNWMMTKFKTGQWFIFWLMIILVKKALMLVRLQVLASVCLSIVKTLKKIYLPA